MSQQTHVLPEGYREVRIQRKGGHERGDYIGRNNRYSRTLEIRSRSDGQLHPLDKAELLPPGLWDLHEFILSAAEVSGETYAQVMAEAKALLPRALTRPSSAHSRPDHSESPHAPVSGRRAA